MNLVMWQATSCPVQQAPNDSLACTESAGPQVNKLESGAKRTRGEVAASQHAADASSEALAEGAPEPPSLTPSAPLPPVSSSAPPHSEPSAPPLPSAPPSVGAGMEANLLASSEALPAQMEPAVAGVPTAMADAVVGVRRGYITRAKSVSGETVSSRAEDALPRKMLRTASPRKMPHIALPSCDFESMDAENTRVLTQDEPRTWHNGMRRFRIVGPSTAEMLSWVVENTSRTLSTITTDTLWLDGFHNWDAVHSEALDASRQQQHTFVISRTQRRRALKSIPGLHRIVAAVQAEIESLHLHDTPGRLEWLTGHILNQGDVNARFTYHQDTAEERNAVGGRRDRRVLYTAIIKLNHGGCTSIRVCGQPEVFYLAPGGSGVIFRSDLHHRTEKAEPGIWKIALFFGVFLL